MATVFNLGNNYLMTVPGTHRDCLQFYSGNQDYNTLIGTDNIRNGNNIGQNSKINNGFGSTIDFGYFYPKQLRTTESPDIYQCSYAGFNIVGVRYGAERDLVSVYALINNKIYRSAEWKDSGNGNLSNGVQLDPQPFGVGINGFPFDNGSSGVKTIDSSYGEIHFDPNLLRFSYKVGNGASFSGERGEMILPISAP